MLHGALGGLASSINNASANSTGSAVPLNHGSASASGAGSTSAAFVDLGAPSYDEDVAEDRRKRILTK